MQVCLCNANILRAYLTLSNIKDDNSPHVMLCLRTISGEDFAFLNQCAAIFKKIFSSDQALNVVFITEKQEHELRSICCPFYTSKDGNILVPDFYLYSSEGYHLDDIPRACRKRQRLCGDHLDGYLLCDIAPVVIGQYYGLQEKNIEHQIFANKIEGTTLFPMTDCTDQIT